MSTEPPKPEGPRRLIVLGTGTEIGKTFVTTALTRALRNQGCSVLALKPIETGCPTSNEPPASSDAWRLENASLPGLVRPHPLYAFPEPISPHLAARRAAAEIDLARVVDWVRAAEHALVRHTLHYDTSWLIVETAGGALSPLSDTATNADLACALDPATWLLVAPDALGVLHDLRATLTALRHLSRPPDVVVLSAARAPDASTGTNAAELIRLRIASPAVAFERDSDASAVLLARTLLSR